MELIDTHAHIYLPEFDKDRSAIIRSAMGAGVKKILMPAIDSTTHERMIKAEMSSGACIAMMGLHPCSVNETCENEMALINSYLQQKKFIAIGEIGLDFYWDKTFSALQYDCFHRQIHLAMQYHLPIAIHSRNATDECIEEVQQYPGLTGVFHCFSGNAGQAMKIIDLGFMLGIGGVLTFKNAGLDKVVIQTGIENVILETDAPYLAPVPYRGKRNESSYLPLVAEKIAAILNMDIADVYSITTRNAYKLFKLNEQLPYL